MLCMRYALSFPLWAGKQNGPVSGCKSNQSTQCTMQRMRILLQQKETGFYFRDVGSWVRDTSEAMDFVSSSAAIDFCVTNKLADMQLVLKFADQNYDIVLPVQPGAPNRQQRAGESA